MKFLRNSLLSFASVLTLLLASPLSAYAWSPFGGVNCSGNAAKSAVCQDGSSTANPLSGGNGLIMNIVDIVAFMAGAAAIIIIVLAALRFVTSGGSSEDVAGARRTLIYALVGLIIVLLSRTLVAFILGKL